MPAGGGVGGPARRRDAAAAGGLALAALFVSLASAAAQPRPQRAQIFDQYKVAADQAKTKAIVAKVNADNAVKTLVAAKFKADDACTKAAASYLANADNMSEQSKAGYSEKMATALHWYNTAVAHHAAIVARLGHGGDMMALGDAAYAVQNYPEARLCYDHWGSYNRPQLGAYQHYWYAVNDFNNSQTCFNQAAYYYDWAYQHTIP